MVSTADWDTRLDNVKAMLSGNPVEGCAPFVHVLLHGMRASKVPVHFTQHPDIHTHTLPDDDPFGGLLAPPLGTGEGTPPSCVPVMHRCVDCALKDVLPLADGPVSAGSHGIDMSPVVGSQRNPARGSPT